MVQREEITLNKDKPEYALFHRVEEKDNITLIETLFPHN